MGSFVTVFTAAETPEYDPDQVTPGVIGFIAIAALAVAVIFLVIDMNRRIRRIKFREEVREQLAQEIAERDAAAGAGTATAESAPADEGASAEAAADDAASDQDQAGETPDNDGR